MHDEWLCRAALQRNLSQEMRHLGPALRSLPWAQPASASACHNRCTKEPPRTMRRCNGRGPQQRFNLCSSDIRSPSDSGSIASTARAESEGQVFKGRMGSSFPKIYLFCHSTVRL